MSVGPSQAQGRPALVCPAPSTPSASASARGESRRTGCAAAWAVEALKLSPPRSGSTAAMASIWPFRRSTDGKKAQSGQPSELRIATSGSFSIRATIESLRVDGAGSYAQPGRARAALFVPTTVTTVQFHGDGSKKPGANSRSSCVHVLQMFTAAETASILDDAKRIGTTIGWCATCRLPLAGALE